VITLLLQLLRLFPFLIGGHRQVALENLALRQQLAVDKRLTPRPKLRPADRLFWAALARVWTGWRRALASTPSATPAGRCRMWQCVDPATGRST
jgi:hypothetical protein